MRPDHAHARRIAERTRSARLIRDSIWLLSSKWSVDVLLALGDGTRRYHELLEDLAADLREGAHADAARDGARRAASCAASTPRCRRASSTRCRRSGATMAPPLKALGSWSLAHGKRVEEARDRFDVRLPQAGGLTRRVLPPAWRFAATPGVSGTGRPPGRGRARRARRRLRP